MRDGELATQMKKAFVLQAQPLGDREFGHNVCLLLTAASVGNAAAQRLLTAYGCFGR